MEFKLPKNPYAQKKDLYKNDTLVLDSGVYIVVGRNGSGKSTLFMLLEDEYKWREASILDNEEPDNTGRYPMLVIDNHHQGGHTAMTNALFGGNMDLLAGMATCSEGQGIMRYLDDVSYKIGQFSKKYVGKHKIVMFDAMDSGTDLSAINEMKNFFKFIYKEEKDITILVSANSYGFVKDMDCIVSNTFEHIKFNNYEEYENFILDNERWKR